MFWLVMLVRAEPERRGQLMLFLAGCVPIAFLSLPLKRRMDQLEGMVSSRSRPGTVGALATIARGHVNSGGVLYEYKRRPIRRLTALLQAGEHPLEAWELVALADLVTTIGFNGFGADKELREFLHTAVRTLVSHSSVPELAPKLRTLSSRWRVGKHVVRIYEEENGPALP
jgi:hypothetical protein